VDADRLVDLRDLRRDDGPKLRHLQAWEDESLSSVDEVLTPAVLGHVARRRHERAKAGGCIGVRNACLDGKMESNRREPTTIREKANDAAVRDDIHHRSGDHVEQALVVRRRFGKRAQRRGQDAKPIVETRVSLCCPHGCDRS
jgi:hypothetical protein